MVSQSSVCLSGGVDRSPVGASCGVFVPCAPSTPLPPTTRHPHTRTTTTTGKPPPSGSRDSSCSRRTGRRGALAGTSLGTWRRSGRPTGAYCLVYVDMYMYIRVHYTTLCVRVCVYVCLGSTDPTASGSTSTTGLAAGSPFIHMYTLQYRYQRRDRHLAGHDVGARHHFLRVGAGEAAPGAALRRHGRVGRVSWFGWVVGGEGT